MNFALLDQKRQLAGEPLSSAVLAPSLERRRLRFYIALMIADIGLLIAAFMLVGFAYVGRKTGLIAVLLPAQLLIPIYLTIALQNGTFSFLSLKDWRTGAMRALAALLIAAALLNFMAFFAKINAQFSRIGFVLGLIVAATFLVGLRVAAVSLIRRWWGPNPMNVLVIDDGGPLVELPHTYRVATADVALSPALDDPHALDLFARYVRNMDQVLVSCPPERRVAWAMVLKGSGVQGEVLSDFMREIGALGVVHRDEIGITTLLVSTGPLGLRARATKRLLDVGASLLALVLALPVLVVAALAIKLEDGGPILFRQKRIGRRNQLFSIYKLRTMKVERTDGDGNRSASKGDDRVTRIGRLLRRTSIDELPQLFNVLRGDMSLVGPRPHAIGSLAGDKLFWEVDQRYWQRHSLRPGLTGLAQVRGFRGATDREVDLTSRLQADLEYITGWTVWRDMRILLATTLVLVHDRAF
ncbi:MAG: exopolysaccharide biosynthesis polyprenyl glycosylphosphotransferase [Porphyrobacter sp.]|nr:exopolysaccharide biosynthesis polyprenyl glycosylphosphotransferase [Porphyrobacter sp.]